MWESRVLRRAFERLELHEGKLSRAVLRGGGGGDVTSLPDTWVGNHPGLPGPMPPDPDAPLTPMPARILSLAATRAVRRSRSAGRSGYCFRNPLSSRASVSSPVASM